MRSTVALKFFKEKYFRRSLKKFFLNQFMIILRSSKDEKDRGINYRMQIWIENMKD